ncbi:succinate-semialdehyde dehydrogenase/glutarate-semialdehyde dehydrogenase [Sphingomonas vulcanisoli]|uniref:Succinate-semialdehyde dehydrogenase/glutarate-semialdehyde dehydrogenase n=1 Tax=Sphingomonas vulcanisoli TaxID=1658060 RepID=A0ABX0TP35_9SPHN|nr:succinate-semialdehyde dehydrogenase/glutarate-semialdehyde dehydrogenase [Sphingomonas vulcanisoli]
MSVIAYPAPSLFIAGIWRAASDGGMIPVVNPATGETIADLPVATRADLDEALAAADIGFKIWRAVSAYDRAKILRAAAQLVRERAPLIGAISTTEQGKPIAESTAEAFACADIFDWYAEEARRAYGRIVPSKHPGVRHLVTKEPIGPVAAFSPWNFPTTIPSRKLAAALAAGCSVIIKPAEETPGSALALARALDDAGLPKGVLNVVFGVPADISSYLIASPVIRKITFTGSTAVGKQLGVLAAQGMKPTTMELGGHAPVIVFADADIDRAAAMMAGGKYRNAGQICIAPTRFYLHDSIHDAFVEQFVKAAGRLKVGNGLDRETTMGPLANPRRVTAMGEFIADAQAHGARLAAGGASNGGPGNFWQPTVLADVPNDARIMNEEPFGPVAVTQRFESFDQVVAEANRLPYGLAAYAWTQSARTVADIGDAIEAGMVGINFLGLTGPETPFGGVKESGHGSEGGSEGLEAYLHHKYIAQG